MSSEDCNDWSFTRTPPASKATAKGKKQRLAIDQPEIPEDIKVKTPKHSQEQPNYLLRLLLAGFWDYWLGSGRNKPGKHDAWHLRKFRCAIGSFEGNPIVIPKLGIKLMQGDWNFLLMHSGEMSGAQINHFALTVLLLYSPLDSSPWEHYARCQLQHFYHIESLKAICPLASQDKVRL